MKLSVLETPEYKADRQLLKLGGYIFHRMVQFLNTMNNGIQEESTKIDRRYEDYLAKYPDQGQMILEDYERTKSDNDKHFAGILLNSSLVASASIFESMFNVVCRHIAYKTRTKFDPDLRHTILTFHKYLCDTGLDIKAIEIHFNHIKLIFQVRNLIAHRGATFNDSTNSHVIKHIKSSKHIKVHSRRHGKPSTFIITDRLYIIEFLHYCRNYLTAVLMLMPPRRLSKKLSYNQFIYRNPQINLDALLK